LSLIALVGNIFSQAFLFEAAFRTASLLTFYRKPFQIAGRLQLERHFYQLISRWLPSCIRPFAMNGLLRHCSLR